MTRTINFQIRIFKCSSCEKNFPDVTFLGDSSDALTDGLTSLTSLQKNEVVIFEMTHDEWRSQNYDDVRERISNRLNRDDLYVPQQFTIIRHDPIDTIEFDPTWKHRPALILYHCPHCEDGKARESHVCTAEEFIESGGVITLVGDLKAVT